MFDCSDLTDNQFESLTLETVSMTKAQAVAEFKECIGNMYRGDKIAQRVAWFGFVDGLTIEGLITQCQRDTWSSPV